MSMDDNLQYAINEQLERVADGLETLGNNFERIAERLESITIQQTKVVEDVVDLTQTQVPSPSFDQHLSLFFESLPTWLYNDLRRKIIPVQLAARIVGMPQSKLQKLSNMGMVKRKNDRYDLVELLGYLEDTFSDYDDHFTSVDTTVTRQ